MGDNREKGEKKGNREIRDEGDDRDSAQYNLSLKSSNLAAIIKLVLHISHIITPTLTLTPTLNL